MSWMQMHFQMKIEVEISINHNTYFVICVKHCKFLLDFGREIRCEHKSIWVTLEQILPGIYLDKL